MAKDTTGSVVTKSRTKRLKSVDGSLKGVPTPDTPQASAVEALVSKKSAVGATNPRVTINKHQTHGGYTPITGGITNVAQLYRKTGHVVKGSPVSFGSVDEYRDYLLTLNLSELHRHAVEQAHVVPIDDRARLIRRLENQWSETCAREGRALAIPKRVPFSPEQTAKQEAIRRQLLSR